MFTCTERKYTYVCAYKTFAATHAHELYLSWQGFINCTYVYADAQF